MRSCVIVSVLPPTLAEIAGCGYGQAPTLLGPHAGDCTVALLNAHKHAAVARPPARRVKVATHGSSQAQRWSFQGSFAHQAMSQANRPGPLIPDPAGGRSVRSGFRGRSGRAGLCVGHPYNHLKKMERRVRKCLFRRTLIRSARFLLRSAAALLPANCGQVPCSAGNVEVRDERKQRREASAKARTPVHFFSRSVFHARHDPCRHGDFRAAAAAGRPHVPQGLVNAARPHCGASRRILANLFTCEG